jgi:hypothetical protein
MKNPLRSLFPAREILPQLGIVAGLPRIEEVTPNWGRLGRRSRSGP